MRVEVLVSWWEQACCGVPFRLGDQVSWDVSAADPTAIPEGGFPRFAEEHHGQTPDDVPRAEVSGTVVAIMGLYYPRVAVPEKDYALADTGHPRSRVLQRVGGSDGAEADEYLVQLEIPDGTRLPDFLVSAETLAHRRVTAEVADRDRTRTSETVGARLERLADEVRQGWGRLADIQRSTLSSAVAVRPYVDGGCAIRWTRQEDNGQDCLRIHAGEGVWVFPAGVRFVEVLAEFVAAAAAGRVEEQVRPLGGPPQRLLTVVHAENGYTWTATTPLEQLGSADSFAVAGALWQHAQRGDHDYPPWAPGT
ncbi:MAG: DUF6578 domain-containing protein [Lacisediminihabitans sp.]